MEQMQLYIKVKLNGSKLGDTKKKNEIIRRQIRKKIVTNTQSRRTKKEKRKMRNLCKNKRIKNKTIRKESKKVRKK